MSTDSLRPIVSVIIPTKDRKEDLSRALESVGKQTYTNVEVIVIDDGSSEELQQVYDQFVENYPSVKLISHRNSTPSGGGYCRRLGTDLAAGDLICFLDDDDLYLPNKIELLEAYLRDRPEVDAVFGRVIVREEVDRLINYKYYNMSLHNHLSEICKLQTNGSLIRRRALQKANFHPALKKYQDTQFHIELCKKNNTHLIKDPVAIWRKNYSTAQVSSVGSKGKRTSIERFRALVEHLSSMNLLTEDEMNFFFRKELKYYAEYGLYRDGIQRLRGRRFYNFFMFNVYYIYYVIGLNKVKNNLNRSRVRADR